MSGTFADDFNANLENEELRREALRIVNAGAVADATEAGLNVRIGTQPPRVNGVSVDPNLTATITWNAVNIADLARYEVQVADNVGMANASTFSVGTTRFSYTEAAETTSYYFRVRAINLSGSAGQYSVVVNGTTGEAIADGSVTTDKIADNAVTSVKIIDAAITSAKIVDLAVENIKIQDNAVTVPVSAFTAGSTTIGVGGGTLQTVTLTTHGQPVYISFSGTYNRATGTGNFSYFLFRDDTLGGSTSIQSTTITGDIGGGGAAPVCYSYTDQPVAGTWTYRARGNASSGTFTIAQRSLFAIEVRK